MTVGQVPDQSSPRSFGLKWSGMTIDDYKVVLAELESVFEMIAAEYAEQGVSLPADSTAIVNA